jgi:hypothetical protein
MKESLKILGLQAYPEKKRLKEAFRRLAKEFHPDTMGSNGDNSQFIRLKKAYDFLSTRMATTHPGTELTEDPIPPEKTFEQYQQEKIYWEMDQISKWRPVMEKVLSPLRSSGNFIYSFAITTIFWFCRLLAIILILGPTLYLSVDYNRWLIIALIPSFIAGAIILSSLNMLTSAIQQNSSTD